MSTDKVLCTNRGSVLTKKQINKLRKPSKDYIHQAYSQLMKCLFLSINEGLCLQVIQLRCRLTLPVSCLSN